MEKININSTHLLVLGNGFDLSLGLKTSYNDFLQSSYFEALIENKNWISEILIKKHHLQKWIDIEKELKILSNSSDKEIESEFKELCEALKSYLNSLTFDELNNTSEAYKLIKNICNQEFLILDFNYTKSTELLLLENNVSKLDIEKKTN